MANTRGQNTRISILFYNVEDYKRALSHISVCDQLDAIHGRDFQPLDEDILKVFLNGLTRVITLLFCKPYFIK